MQQLLESNERHEKRLEETAEREAKADARDELMCNTLVGFLSTFGQYMQHKMGVKNVDATDAKSRNQPIDEKKRTETPKSLGKNFLIFFSEKK